MDLQRTEIGVLWSFSFWVWRFRDSDVSLHCDSWARIQEEKSPQPQLLMHGKSQPFAKATPSFEPRPDQVSCHPNTKLVGTVAFSAFIPINRALD